MQTVKPPRTEEPISPELDTPVNKPPRVSRKRLVSVGLALAGLVVYGLYVSRGWSFYERIPGGRKILLPLAVVIFVGLAGYRMWLAVGPQGVRKSIAWALGWMREWGLAGVIVGLALLTRVWSVGFGLPYLEQVDEWNVADRALHIVQTGSFDPHDYRNPALPDNDRQAFTYPTLYTYLQTGVFVVRFLQGVAADRYDGTGGLDSLTVKPDFYLWGRVLTAILGAGTVLLVLLVGSKYYNRRVGLVAALFLTFFYLHVYNSRFITTDVPSGFFALLPFLAMLPILKGRDERKWYVIAGICCGLAMGSKYNNALIVLPLVLAHLLGRPRPRWFNLNLLWAMLATGAAFFVSSPFILWHVPDFLTDIGAIIRHYNDTGHAGFEGDNNWLYYLGAMAQENLAVVVLAVVGIAIAFARHNKNDIVLLSFPLLSYLQLASYKVNFTRNLMPIVPFVAIFAGLALVLIGEQVARRLPQHLADWQNPALGTLAVVAIISPALTIAQFNLLNTAPTTRAQATNWIETNVPAGSKIWVEPFSVELLPRNRYRVEGGKGILTNSAEWYAANGYNYLVLSEAYHKEARESGNDFVRDRYRKLIDGPRPSGLQLVRDFQGNNTDQPGPRLIILSTGLKTVTRNAADYSISKPLALNFGQRIKLIGYDAPATVKPGTNLSLKLYWETLAAMPDNYTVFVHLISADNKTVAQLDLAPLANTRPTSLWQPGEILRDEYPLALPSNLANGEYRLTIGLYLPTNSSRLATPDGQTEVELTKVKVEK